MPTCDTAKANEVAEHCLGLCFLGDLRDKLAGGLTIGNKKRLEVARSLATGPKLLLLDESVAGLTSTEVKEMVEVIVRLKQEGVTILMVEHIMEAIMPIADKIVVLASGKKIAEDSPQAVVNDPTVITAYFGEKYAKRLRGINNTYFPFSEKAFKEWIAGKSPDLKPRSFQQFLCFVCQRYQICPVNVSEREFSVQGHH